MTDPLYKTIYHAISLAATILILAYAIAGLYS